MPHLKTTGRQAQVLTWAAYDISNNALRGTTAIRRLPGLGHNLYVTSDSRKKVYANLSLLIIGDLRI